MYLSCEKDDTASGNALKPAVATNLLDTPAFAELHRETDLICIQSVAHKLCGHPAYTHSHCTVLELRNFPKWIQRSIGEYVGSSLLIGKRHEYCAFRRAIVAAHMNGHFATP